MFADDICCINKKDTNQLKCEVCPICGRRVTWSTRFDMYGMCRLDAHCTFCSWADSELCSDNGDK